MNLTEELLKLKSLATPLYKRVNVVVTRTMLRDLIANSTPGRALNSKWVNVWKQSFETNTFNNEKGFFIVHFDTMQIQDGFHRLCGLAASNLDQFELTFVFVDDNCDIAQILLTLNLNKN